jgi:hypothetical protein
VQVVAGVAEHDPCRWSPALLSTIRAGASSARRGIETDADSPATNTVSNRATAA